MRKDFVRGWCSAISDAPNSCGAETEVRTGPFTPLAEQEKIGRRNFPGEGNDEEAEKESPVRLAAGIVVGEDGATESPEQGERDGAVRTVQHGAFREAAAHHSQAVDAISEGRPGLLGAGFHVEFTADRVIRRKRYRTLHNIERRVAQVRVARQPGGEERPHPVIADGVLHGSGHLDTGATPADREVRDDDQGGRSVGANHAVEIELLRNMQGDRDPQRRHLGAVGNKRDIRAA